MGVSVWLPGNEIKKEKKYLSKLSQTHWKKRERYIYIYTETRVTEIRARKGYDFGRGNPRVGLKGARFGESMNPEDREKFSL